MEIKEMIAKVQKHFIDKLLSKEFEVVEIETHTMKIKIDGFFLCIWISNGINHCNFYNGFTGFSTLNMPNLTKEQQKIIWPYIEDILKSNEKLNRQKQIADLEARIKELKSL